MIRQIVDLDRGLVDMDDGDYLKALQRSLCDLIQLAKDSDLNSHPAVRQAKELIRCRVLDCGLAGACNGVGLETAPCPLRRPA